NKDNFDSLSEVIHSYLTNNELYKIFISQMQDKVYRTESPLNLSLMASPVSDKIIPDNAKLDINIINNIDYNWEYLIINGVKVNVSLESKAIFEFLINNPMVEFKKIKTNFQNIPVKK
ncbi:TPA: hypothetical protein ACGDTB_003926, partial [Acinetobacter baumannii]